MKSPDVIERYAGLGGEPRTSTPDELAKFLRAESARWAAIIKTVGVKGE